MGAWIDWSSKRATPNLTCMNKNEVSGGQSPHRLRFDSTKCSQTSYFCLNDFFWRRPVVLPASNSASNIARMTAIDGANHDNQQTHNNHTERVNCFLNMFSCCVC